MASGEFERIARIRSAAARRRPGIVLGIGDDAALLAPRPGFDTAISTDLFVENVHFRREWTTSRQLGAKAVAVAVSDMAAIGAQPAAVLLSLAIPADIGDADLDGFLAGASSEADRWNASIVGGDLSRSPDGLVVDVVLVGHVEEGRALRRSGAIASDDLYVSGVLGTSAAGLQALRASGEDTVDDAERDVLIRAHLAPEPRVALGRALVTRDLARCAIDVSDGLSSDLRHLCDESDVGASIVAELLPAPAGIAYALHGGEQYELLFAAPVHHRADIDALAGELGLPLTRIGRFEGPAHDVWLETGGELTRLEPGGFDHFADR